MVAVCSRRNGFYFSDGNALKKTEGGTVRISDSCGWTNNTPAFLKTGSRPVRDGDSALCSE